MPTPTDNIGKEKDKEKNTEKSKELKFYLLKDEDESTCLWVRHYTRNKAIQDFCSEFIMEDYWFFKSSDNYKVKTPSKSSYERPDHITEPCVADNKRCLINKFYWRVEDNCDWCNEYAMLNTEDGKNCLCNKCL